MTGIVSDFCITWKYFFVFTCVRCDRWGWFGQSGEEMLKLKKIFFLSTTQWISLFENISTIVIWDVSFLWKPSWQNIHLNRGFWTFLKRLFFFLFGRLAMVIQWYSHQVLSGIYETKMQSGKLVYSYSSL